MKKFVIALALSLGLSNAALASSPLAEGTYTCEQGNTVTLTLGPEIFPQPYTVSINGTEHFGLLRTSEHSVVDFSDGGFFRMDPWVNDTYVIGYMLVDDIQLYTLLDCVLAN